MNTAILTALLALGPLGAAAGLAAIPTLGADAAPACTDLAGQGSLCYEVVADPAGGNFDANATVVVAPGLPAAASAPACTDLAGQGSLCYEVVADPAGGSFDANVTAIVEPNPPLALLRSA